MKTYISGQITGLAIFRAEEIFEEAETFLLLQGREVINPMKLSHEHNRTWEDYMLEDIKHLFECKSIFMLKNWIHSKGAKIEHSIAEQLQLEIIYQ